MSRKIELNIPLNRAEGDLEVRIALEDGQVVEAWSSGTMYRGFENLMRGRGPLDGLVITPRICGICSTAHLTVAAKALDMIAGVTIPDNAKRIRSLTLMVEFLQSDMRQAFLMYTADFATPIYQDQPLFAEAVQRYEPLKGQTVLAVIRETKKVLEIIAILGGQWPHSSFMVPGGVVFMPETNELLQCQHLLTHYRRWYERRILGCSLDRWQQIETAADLDAWLEESKAHQNSEVGFFLRFSRAIGLAELGRGHGNFISYGGLDMPLETTVQPFGASNDHPVTGLIPAGFAQGTARQPFDQTKISEHLRYAWFKDQEQDDHPFEGETHPDVDSFVPLGQQDWAGEPYSWAKAARYDGLPTETGPLAEMIMAQHPLITDLVNRDGPNALVRELARIIRSTILLPAMAQYFQELLTTKGSFYHPVGKIVTGQGFGLAQATRGALGHWVKIEHDRISHYQVISPTTWNGSPRDKAGVRGPWEEALIGTPVRDPANPVEVGHVIRSFDPCLVCTVHTLNRSPNAQVRRLV